MDGISRCAPRLNLNLRDQPLMRRNNEIQHCAGTLLRPVPPSQLPLHNAHCISFSSSQDVYDFVVGTMQYWLARRCIWLASFV